MVYLSTKKESVGHKIMRVVGIFCWASILLAFVLALSYLATVQVHNILHNIYP